MAAVVTAILTTSFEMLQNSGSYMRCAEPFEESKLGQSVSFHDRHNTSSIYPSTHRQTADKVSSIVRL